MSALRSRHITDRPPHSRVRPIDLPLLDHPARRQGVCPQVIIKSKGRRIHLHRCETHLPRPVQGLLPVHDDGAVLKKDGDEGVIQAARAAGCVRVSHDGHIGRRELIAQRRLETACSIRVRYAETGLSPVWESKGNMWSTQPYRSSTFRSQVCTPPTGGSRRSTSACRSALPLGLVRTSSRRD